MWLKLGDNELVNLNHVISIKKGVKNTIEIHYQGLSHAKVLPFSESDHRDRAFDRIIENLVKLGRALE